MDDLQEDPIRKISLAFDASILELAGLTGVGDYFKRVEKLEELRGFSGETFFVARLTVTDKLKDPREMVGIFKIKELQIISANHPDYMVVYRVPKNWFFLEILKELDFDGYTTYPEYFDGEHYVTSFYTHQSTLPKIFQVLHDFQIPFQVRSISAPFFTSDYLLREFSPKQLEMLKLAGKNGYYNFPRKTKAKAIAEKARITVQVLHEHLRKAENKVMNRILEDLVLD